jgi:2-polyprenyl-3-methyl-5-hydroxy-6-metoxy-1,4-benzoquinol methylase
MTTATEEKRPTEAAYYDEVYKKGEDLYLRAHPLSLTQTPVRAAVVGHLMRKFKNPEKNICEIGCGPGYLAEMLQSIHWYNYVGVDFSRIALEMFRTRSPLPTVCMDIRSDAFFEWLEKLASIEVFVCLEVLEHLEQDRELLRRLPKGKHLVGSVPNFASEAHQRSFESAEAVEERYREFVPDMAAHRILHWWIFGGTLC